MLQLSLEGPTGFAQHGWGRIARTRVRGGPLVRPRRLHGLNLSRSSPPMPFSAQLGGRLLLVLLFSLACHVHRAGQQLHAAQRRRPAVSAGLLASCRVHTQSRWETSSLRLRAAACSVVRPLQLRLGNQPLPRGSAPAARLTRRLLLGCRRLKP